MRQKLTKSPFLLRLSPKKIRVFPEADHHNPSQDDSFLESLADGGFQVGQFAKAHFQMG